MKPEILLYGPLWSDSLADTMLAMASLEDGEDFVLRINTSGGSVEGTFGVITKFSEMSGKKVVKVDGGAHSMGAFFLCYADEVEAADFARFTLHRAALSADQAKKLGLVDKIVKITPQKRAEIIAQSETLATAFKPTDQELSIPKTPLKMNLAELKANHPEAYKMAVNEGIEQEKDRAGAWLTFVDVDPTAVVDGVKEGKGISQTQMVELTRKSISKSALVDAKIDSPKAEATVTDEPKNILPEQTAEIEKQAEFSAEVFKALDLKIEKV